MICPYTKQVKRILLEPDGVDLMTEFVHEQFGECKGAECMAWESGRCILIQKGKNEGGN